MNPGLIIFSIMIAVILAGGIWNYFWFKKKYFPAHQEEIRTQIEARGSHDILGSITWGVVILAFLAIITHKEMGAGWLVSILGWIPTAALISWYQIKSYRMYIKSGSWSDYRWRLWTGSPLEQLSVFALIALTGFLISYLVK